VKSESLKLRPAKGRIATESGFGHTGTKRLRGGPEKQLKPPAIVMVQEPLRRRYKWLSVSGWALQDSNLRLQPS